MKKPIFLSADKATFIAGTALLVTLAGCIPVGRTSGYQERPGGQLQTAVVLQDDYDYYPGYEIYYSRNRHEYVYRDGNNWVRRPEPRGVSASVLLAAPSVRLDFHDSPERHNSTVVRSYPKSWKQPAAGHAEKPGQRDDKKNNKKDGDRKDGDQKN